MLNRAVFFFGLALALASLSFSQVSQSKTQIVLLGTGTPNADPERFGPSTAIVVNEQPYLIDCGPGVIRRATAAHAKGVKGLAVEKLKTLFITHLHSDHTVGLPDVIFTPAVLDRHAPLAVYGPPGTRRMVNHLLAAWSEDVAMRVNGLERGDAQAYRVNVHEIAPGVIYRDANVTVKAFAVPHGSWRHAFGFRFETVDKTMVISGDTGATEEIVKQCNGCDVLMHEVYSVEGFKRRTPQWQRYHSTFHTSSVQLAELAQRARPKRLILHHQLLWGATVESLLNEMRAIWNGEIIYGNDLDIF
jgi:ribonuclease BN (tRNA processing enzyme)